MSPILMFVTVFRRPTIVQTEVPLKLQLKICKDYDFRIRLLEKVLKRDYYLLLNFFDFLIDLKYVAHLSLLPPFSNFIRIEPLAYEIRNDYYLNRLI